ncbi:MAG: polyphosphate kinase 1 [Algisphaera sp.]
MTKRRRTKKTTPSTTKKQGRSSKTAVAAPSAALADPGAPASGEAFLNREASWLEFNRRVLHEALDDRTPLLERIGFLAIFNSNLDEFFQKRVGGLKRQIQAGVMTRTPDGYTPEEQLAMIRQMVQPMLTQQAECFTTVVKPALAAAGIHLRTWEELDESGRAQATAYFDANLFPVVTPLSVDPGHPFPFISNLSTSLGVMLQYPEAEMEGASSGNVGPAIDDDPDAGRLHFARVKVPQVLPRWVRLKVDAEEGEKSGKTYQFISLQAIIHQHLSRLFEGMLIKQVEPFRITRNADVDRGEEDAEDLLELIEQELRDRRFARAVRLEIDDQPFHPMNQFLMSELGLSDSDLYPMSAELDFTDLWTVHGGVNRPDLKYTPWTPLVPPRLVDTDSNIFSIIDRGDLLVHHPYESFSASVERFIRSAATDPDVVAIKLTLYRTAKDSPFIPDLIKAAESGKQVVVLVELKARFDEERNVQLAQRLEKAGIHVVYGVVGYKTHTKTSLVVRRTAGGLKTYAHIGTGNYNAKTANLYTDLGLFTCDPRITGDLVELFHFLTGRSRHRDYKHLLIAPTNMRRRFEELIDREIAHADTWRAAGEDPATRPRIVAKMNSLEDQAICQRLYNASSAGVKVQLIVRGFCCLRPGIPGLSDNITVQSVIGRFLEHSRIYMFGNAGKPDYFIGSADWMYRNLNNRVECITPIYDLAGQKRLQVILDTCLADQRQVWDLDANGKYVQRTPPKVAAVELENAAADPVTAGTHRHLMYLMRRMVNGE